MRSGSADFFVSKTIQMASNSPDINAQLALGIFSINVGRPNRFLMVINMAPPPLSAPRTGGAAILPAFSFEPMESDAIDNRFSLRINGV